MSFYALLGSKAQLVLGDLYNIAVLFVEVFGMDVESAGNVGSSMGKPRDGTQEGAWILAECVEV
jgi:hypothetical protein